MTHLERPEAKRDIATGDIARYGHWFWDELNEVVDQIPCESCRKGGREFLQAARDTVAINNGKAPFDPKNLVGVVRIFDQALAKCHSQGHCSPARGLRPHGLTACEKRHPSIVHKIERCVREVKDRPGVVNPFAICRASVKCP